LSRCARSLSDCNPARFRTRPIFSEIYPTSMNTRLEGTVLARMVDNEGAPVMVETRDVLRHHAAGCTGVDPAISSS